MASIVGVALAAEAGVLAAATEPLAAGAWLEAGAAWLEAEAEEPEQAVRPKSISRHRTAQIDFFMGIPPMFAFFTCERF
jgi:hypothetical protein